MQDEAAAAANARLGVLKQLKSIDAGRAGLYEDQIAACTAV